MAEPAVATSQALVEKLLDRALQGEVLSHEEGYLLIAAPAETLPTIMSTAASMRKGIFPQRIVTFSKKIFLPLTNLCRDRCGYCTFVQSPTSTAAHTMTPDEVLEVATEGARLGCKEALFSLGDHPEYRHPEMTTMLQRLGYESTPEYVAAMSELVLRETGLIPHTNCGLLDREEMVSIGRFNASMGIMLENVSPRLLRRGEAHFGTETKDPSLRIATLSLAGELGIAMTTGILIGIGETVNERIDSLIAIRDLHKRYGNIQEVIIQNFRAKPQTRMQRASEPSSEDMLRTLAIARILLGAEINIQAPPNLNTEGHRDYLLTGMNDWGGISPLTKDFINPESPWPMIEQLRSTSADMGFELKERLALYPEFVTNSDWNLPQMVSERVLKLADADGLANIEITR